MALPWAAFCYLGTSAEVLGGRLGVEYLMPGRATEAGSWCWSPAWLWRSQEKVVEWEGWEREPAGAFPQLLWVC